MSIKLLGNPKVLPPLDPNFKPVILEKIAYEKLVKESGKEAVLKIAVERSGGMISVKEITVFADDAQYADFSCFYAERYVKTLLWVMGGFKVYLSGPRYICDYVKKAYNRMIVCINADIRQSAGYILCVGVGDLSHKEFRTNCDYFSNHS
jgi:hypothetical protein